MSEHDPGVPPVVSAGDATAAPEGAQDACPVVGVGASAGGLEAVTALLRALPADAALAVVVVMHLEPARESGLVEIFARATPMAVVAATDGARVEAGRVYVIPPDAGLLLEGGALRLAPRDAAPGRAPVDAFLRSLAAEAPGCAAAVVLSGTGSDGARGVAAVRAAGGVTFAQDGSAQCEAMPRAAVDTGCVDYVLPPEAIARELLRIPRGVAGDEGPLKQVFELLRDAGHVDFSHYKRAGFLRRVQRRLVLTRRAGLREYVDLLRSSPAEVEALAEDALIHVTSFFRDPQVFDALRQVALPRLVERRPRGGAVRVWVPGCSTGEEVYSIAIALLEFLGDEGREVRVQVFGTDASAPVIDRARAGRYPRSIEADVSPARLRRFFTEADGGYRIRRDVRDLCVFARHDVTRDPPFSDLDLVSCRNLLIYLDAALQARVLPVFHYALRPGGLLLLGASEGVGASAGFTPVDPASRILARAGAASPPPPAPYAWGASPPVGQRPAARTAGHGDIFREADRMVLAAHGPPGVVVADDLTILQFRGHTGPYVEHAPGPADLDLLRVASDDLRPTLRHALDEARRTGAAARGVAPRVTESGEAAPVAIEVLPFQAPSSEQRLFIVLFGAAPGVPAEPAPPAPPLDPEEQLRRELASTREHLHALIERLETGHEELRAAHDDVVSSNEELRSTNEELRITKEDLRVANEELAAVNGELLVRNAEATRLGDDLANLVESVDIPIVILGRDGRVRRFTPAAGRVLGLAATDLGRPFLELRSRLGESRLDDLVAEVQAGLAPRERAVLHESGRWYQLAVRPYVTADARVDGVTLALVDIDAIKRGERLVAEARDYAEAIVATTREGLLVLDGELRVVSANRAFYETFRASPAETEGRALRELGAGQWGDPPLGAALAGLLASPSAEPLRDVRVEREFPGLGRRVMLLNARRMEGTDPAAPRVLVAVEDATGRVRAAEASRKEDEAGFREMLASAAEPVVIVDGRARVHFANEAAHRAFGYAPGAMAGLALGALVPGALAARHAAHHRAFMAAPAARPMAPGADVRARRRDGTEFPVEVTLAVMRTVDGPHAVAFLNDISERRAGEARIRDYQERLQQAAFDAALAEQRERRRIAADLHDRIGQSLVLLQHRLASVREGVSGPLAAHVDECAQLVAQSVADTRTLTFELSPPILYDLGLRAAIGWLAEQFEERFGLRVAVDGGDVPGLDEDVAAVLFRAVRELLTNVVKHARSDRARVSIHPEGGHVAIAVEDAGVGFDDGPAGAHPRGGFGLFSIRERVSRLGGAVEVTSAAGAGARVALRVPVAGQVAAPAEARP